MMTKYHEHDNFWGKEFCNLLDIHGFLSSLIDGSPIDDSAVKYLMRMI